MKNLLKPINRHTAIVALTDLPTRLTTNTRYSYLYRGSEGKTLQAQAQQNLRWHQLFRAMNRRDPA